MDDESGEFMERAELACVGRSESEMGDRHEAVGAKQGVDSRDEVRHNEKTNQLFVKAIMKVDGVTGMNDHRQGAGTAVRLNSDEAMQIGSEVRGHCV